MNDNKIKDKGNLNVVVELFKNTNRTSDNKTPAFQWDVQNKTIQKH